MKDAPALVDALRREGIVTSERAGNLRISAHAYNSAEDVDAVLAALARSRRLLIADQARPRASNGRAAGTG